MRYVIVIAAIALFLIWDGMYNGGYYLDAGIRWLAGVMQMIGVS